MAKARTSRPTPAATEGRTELEFIADRLIEKVWQGDEAKRGIATQAASVALAAIQDHTAARYMETADQFDGRDMLNFWHNRQMLEEARASVALDKGDGETQSVDEAYIRKPSDLVTTEPGPSTEAVGEVKGMPPGEFPGWMRSGRFERREEALERIVNEDRELLDRLAEEDGHPDEWRDDL